MPQLTGYNVALNWIQLITHVSIYLTLALFFLQTPAWFLLHKCNWGRAGAGRTSIGECFHQRLLQALLCFRCYNKTSFCSCMVCLRALIYPQQAFQLCHYLLIWNLFLMCSQQNQNIGARRDTTFDQIDHIIGFHVLYVLQDVILLCIFISYLVFIICFDPLIFVATNQGCFRNSMYQMDNALVASYRSCLLWNFWQLVVCPINRAGVRTDLGWFAVEWKIWILKVVLMIISLSSVQKRRLAVVGMSVLSISQGKSVML